MEPLSRTAERNGIGIGPYCTIVRQWASRVCAIRYRIRRVRQRGRAHQSAAPRLRFGNSPSAGRRDKRTIAGTEQAGREVERELSLLAGRWSRRTTDSVAKMRANASPCRRARPFACDLCDLIPKLLRPASAIIEALPRAGGQTKTRAQRIPMRARIATTS